eukprot:CAMPEP_0197833462 /NCGR_PEP_ID=MMETSP1437-20131217/19101_1 /TAXON_ID=49252 ORGANISM="Eucampia antarctica, Strain CCMP1452" /NCGR_SAMPLE_ID=MMETSP1437 /ASSEMBLY_ACC=CAM_ASM_001096 /LENGTH=61 /DNA_ID=CAMNT_0043437533 /DNA_START=171 /DNA_END=356 /DNA_ORIENTATION=-
MSDDSDRIHSTDIAFKPSESGWGFSNKYNNNFDNIFSNGKGDKKEKEGQPKPQEKSTDSSN